jgi:hypothetical protein
LISIPSVLQLANVARARRPMMRTPAAVNWAAIAANLRSVCHTDGGVEREAFYTRFYE